MKKFVVMSLILCLCFSACSKKQTENTTTEANKQEAVSNASSEQHSDIQATTPQDATANSANEDLPELTENDFTLQNGFILPFDPINSFYNNAASTDGLYMHFVKNEHQGAIQLYLGYDDKNIDTVIRSGIELYTLSDIINPDEIKELADYYRSNPSSTTIVEENSNYYFFIEETHSDPRHEMQLKITPKQQLSENDIAVNLEFKYYSGFPELPKELYDSIIHDVKTFYGDFNAPSYDDIMQ